ncbi:MAG TPA: AMP-binding protein [Nocardioides sp.]
MSGVAPLGVRPEDWVRVPAATAARYREAGLWLPETLGEFVAERCARFAERIAVAGAPARDRTAHVRLTYAELTGASARLAALLADQHGVREGDRVVVQLPNCVEHVVAVAALVRMGALPVFTLPAHREAELSAFHLLAEPVAHLVAGSGWGVDHVAVAERAGAWAVERGGRAPRVVDLAVVDVLRERDGAHEPAAFPAPVRVDAEEVAFLQLSGGTTGVPKLIPRTHGDYLYSVRGSVEICGLDADDALLVALPAAHNFPMSSPGILGALHVGARVVLAPDPSPRTAFALVERERVTVASLVPPLVLGWLSARRDRFDLTSLRLLGVGGARLADVTAGRVHAELGCALQQVFGMAEGLVCYTRLDDPAELVETTQGRPISDLDEVRVVDDEDVDVRDGTPGHLLTRGPYTIRGYYRAPEQQATAFTADGFYRTGDVVVRLPSGHLRVTGRSKDQVNRGGEKVAAEEVEEHLLGHPAVHDAAVVAVPDPLLGEKVCAVLVVEADHAAPGVPELRRHLLERGLAPYKVPDRFETVTAFPTSGVGKTSRRDLRRTLAAALTGPGT